MYSEYLQDFLFLIEKSNVEIEQLWQNKLDASAWSCCCFHSSNESICEWLTGTGGVDDGSSVVVVSSWFSLGRLFSSLEETSDSIDFKF